MTAPTVKQVHAANTALWHMAYKHIIAQGVSAMLGNSCRYRTEDGKGCAFSPAIIKYSEKFEGRTAAALLEDCASAIKFYTNSLDPTIVDCNRGFADQVQSAHDTPATTTRYSPEEFLIQFKDAMINLAKQYSIEVKLI